MDHAVDALRDAGQGFLLNLTTSAGRSVEAMGRAIGGQAIVRIRELSGLRRELAEMTFRHKALLEETEMLRGFIAAAPWPIWTRRAAGGLSFANAAPSPVGAGSGNVRPVTGESVAPFTHGRIAIS